MVVEMLQNSTFQNFIHIQHLYVFSVIFIHFQHLYLFKIQHLYLYSTIRFGQKIIMHSEIFY